MENILDIIESIAHEKGLSPDNVTEAVKAAFIQTAKRLVNPEFAYDAEIDPETKSIRVYQTITVVEDDDELLEGEEAAAYIGLTRAKEEVDPDVEVGDEFQIEHDIESHGRTAAATLYREIEFHIQRMVE
ncbi:MAG: NusA N-terminal domain-containing protein, partial [Campylobacterales bacterium]